MKFFIDGVPVAFARVGFQDSDGYILQLLVDVSEEGGHPEEVAKQIADRLKVFNGGAGVMGPAPSEDGPYVEVRMLGGLELPVILCLMSNGMAVVQYE